MFGFGHELIHGSGSAPLFFDAPLIIFPMAAAHFATPMLAS
jgi:hypothetical protein